MNDDGASTSDSAEPSAERDLVLRSLDTQRDHVLAAIDGLADEQLRRAVLPSGWCCLGLVQHLTLAVERYWCRTIIGGEPLGWFPEEPGADWQVSPDTPVEEVLAGYRDELVRSNDVLARASLDAAPIQRDPIWDGWGVDFPDVRTIALHLITETATHAGHLDVARELLDGRQWLVVT
jgi:hypothetical protein